MANTNESEDRPKGAHGLDFDSLCADHRYVSFSRSLLLLNSSIHRSLLTRGAFPIGVDIDHTKQPPRVLRKTVWDEDQHQRWKGPPPSIQV
jgi:hypothetical protein